MKTQITLLRLILVSTFLFLFVKYNPLNAKNESNIGIDYKPGINYVTHLYTLANLGYNDKEYIEKYGSYLSPEDKKLLLKHKDLLQFGQGKTGKLTVFFFFIPAYADLKTYDEYNNYFIDIVSTIEEKSFSYLKKYIPSEYESFLDENVINDLLQVQKEFNEISSVYLRNINTYIEKVYPLINKDLDRQKELLNNLIQNNDIINQWETETNYTWNKGDYIYLLFRAGKHGPSFNNLSSNLNSCYYKIDENYLIDMFSHEFGIFLMYYSIMPLTEKYKVKYPDYENDYTVGRAYWMAYEMLSIFFNIKINDRKTNDYYNFREADPIAFMEIYTKLYEKGITDPKELYERGINKYMKPEGYWNNGVRERYESLKI